MDKFPKIKILVACHKASDTIREDDIYMPVQVGKALHPDLDLGFQGDDTGDNISAKNGSFCELTALYWAWKNLKDVDYIGLCHYRRYFDLQKRNMLSCNVLTEKAFQGEDPQNRKLRALVGAGKIILPKEEFFPVPLIYKYAYNHVSDDFRTVFDIIGELYPQDVDAVKYYMETSHRLSPYNMFVMPWAEFDAYCQWLFSILFEAEKRINIENYSPYQKRIFGFMSERLLNAYIFARKKVTEQLPVIFIDNDKKSDSVKKYLLNKYRGRVVEIIDKLAKNA